jgi:hypothetical protein
MGSLKKTQYIKLLLLELKNNLSQKRSRYIQCVPEIAPQRKQTNADDNLDSKNANEEQLIPERDL